MKVRTLLAAVAAVGALALAAAAIGAWTSSASGAGGDPPPDIGVLAELSVNGSTVAFFSDVHLSSGFAASELELGARGATLPVKRTPPSVTLRHGLTTSRDLSAWHEAALAGDVNGRRDAQITMYASDLTPIARWSLRSAWPSKYQLDGLSGDPAPTESVTLVGDSLQRIAP